MAHQHPEPLDTPGPALEASVVMDTDQATQAWFSSDSTPTPVGSEGQGGSAAPQAPRPGPPRSDARTGARPDARHRHDGESIGVIMSTADAADLARLRVDESIRNAGMLAKLEMAGERIDPMSSTRTVERIQALRLALGGIGRVGNQFDRYGQAVGDQIAITLTSHDVEALLMLLTGRARFETIPP